MENEKEVKEEGLYAVVRIKGAVRTTKRIIDTLERLGLNRVNSCVIVPSDPTHKGMLKKVSGHVTWGEVDSETLKGMIEKRGAMENGKEMDKKAAGALAGKIMKGKTLKGLDLSRVLKLSSPSKGFRSVRANYPRGDAGYRGAEINALIRRML